MAFKFVAFAAIIAVARAGVLAPAVATYAAAPALSYAASPLAYASPIARVAAVPAIAKVAVPAEFDAHPQYNYAYSVADAITGDNKHQEETRDGDVVKGSYSLVEADGTRRIVEYTADPINGFNAVVHKEGLAVQKAVVAAPAYAKVAAPVAYASPLAYHAPAPLAYHAPAVVKTAYASPVAAYYH